MDLHPARFLSPPEQSQMNKVHFANLLQNMAARAPRVSLYDRASYVQFVGSVVGATAFLRQFG